MSDGLKPTSGTEWREAASVVLRLPSGRVARVRAVGPDVVLRHGNLPDSLTALVAQIMDGEEVQPDPQTLDELRGFAEFLDIVCQCAMVDPRVVAEPTKDNEIGFDDLDWPDKVFLMGMVGASTRSLENFREEQADAVDAVVSTEGHGEASEPDTQPE